MRGTTCLAGCILFATVAARAADEGKQSEWEVRGWVVDEAGEPVANATVAREWMANGTGKRQDGTPLDWKAENLRDLWGHVGEMEVRIPDVAKTGTDGSFRLKIPDCFHVVMALDEARKIGGLAVLPKGRENLPIEIRLGPLVRVRGTFAGPEAGKPPYWTHVYVDVPPDPTRPLDYCRVVQCGSMEARFEVSLPPGRYALDAYGSSTRADVLDLEATPDPEFVASAGARDLDLGLLRLTTAPDSLDIDKRVEQAKADGSWNDYTKHYGEPAPRWQVTDARGVSKDVQPADYRGKWLLVDFWAFSCIPCVRNGLPELTRFYEEHSAQRDRFQILAFCLDFEGSMKSMADVDRRLEPIVKHVWDGKTLPFPVVLDSTFVTNKRYGLRTVRTILIDPDGNLVPGDAATLAEHLDSPR